MDTLENLIGTVRILMDTIRIQRETIKMLRGDDLSSMVSNFDLRSMNKDILKGVTRSETHQTTTEKNMNIHQISPRPDCIYFAKCGKRSIAYCRRYGAKECVSCNLVKRKPRNRVIVDGIERKRCTHCGKVLPLHRFYDRIVVRNGKSYHLKTSWCRLCMSGAQCERNRRKSLG